ncbi:M28 family peptidase [Sphingomonas dokdonensis]|uniref:Leupeptin-inactivating enzyme 1 n=1 Tax=Sphingomonas dokdonensis TaxID=344880 RepID=A0A245ZFC2_9SPHN|nr:M28 family peptidase [Sphingomonas dokdonensis]OWK28440.1 leupeptin-inactivating enzyme 1 precursor [Sphingomonas dokdonensis]
MLLLSLLLAGAAPTISPAEIKADVRELASDAFAGRGPGEDGEAATLAYLERQFASAGLQPAGKNGSWYQDVPLVRLDRLPGAALSLTVAGRPMPLAIGREASLGLANAGRTQITDAPLVFAGFGIVDPATGHDDFAGVDMTGKVALVLANDPDFEAGKDLGFEGKRLVIGGRVGSKFAAARKAGAIGVLVIHEDAAASYPFSQVAQPLPSAVPAPLTTSSLQMTGWLDRSAWAPLLKTLKLDLATLKARARVPGFRAMPLDAVKVSASGEVKAMPFTSRNIIARLPGTTRPDEVVLYGAHWDANGRNAPDATGDAIRNGAVDNGIGTAELLAVARAFAKAPRLGRTVMFAAWTAEEKGLLGASFYAAHPFTPLETTVAVINLDPHVALPTSTTIELIGGGRTTLEDELTRVAAQQGLRVVPEPSPEAGWYFRSDHYPFASAGVPALAFRIGRDLAAGGAAAGNRIVERYNARCYHQPCDAFDAAWTAQGAAQEANVAFALGRELAAGRSWPDWTDPALQTKRDMSKARRQ